MVDEILDPMIDFFNNIKPVVNIQAPSKSPAEIAAMFKNMVKNNRLRNVLGQIGIDNVTLDKSWLKAGKEAIKAGNPLSLSAAFDIDLGKLVGDLTAQSMIDFPPKKKFSAAEKLKKAMDDV